MKILVTGSRGLFGEELVRVLSLQHDVVPTTRCDMDICDYHSTIDRIRSESPDLVVHAAAFTNTEACEQDPDTAFSVNALGTENVALACQKIDAAMLYVSSAGVFSGGKESPYTEFDLPDPLTIYHKSKLAGEQATTRLLRRYYIVRVGWLFGGSFHQRRNFVARRLDEARGTKQLGANAEQWGTPTYIRDAAEQIDLLVSADRYGTYHIGNAGHCSRFEYVKEILDAAGCRTEVIPIPASSFKRVAPVARSEAIRNYRLQLLGLDRMRPWKEAIHDYVRELMESLKGQVPRS